ncbi:LOW QUALITY PROTEIN: SWI/SNF-related matrix-associated actin-dependent regulator of chromatin subfamily A-like protein 1 [Pollicipes pollicipes]|uniref:LOW QUALITY PROTEIN: SWI/SNF-related matrix-associated actin-dependent regulator of chromatin subfamily A-like protein 1 n=1 Tax=Pollicipes pollicipes TaxID=41117 RepID=UPI001884D3AF|nr:LOW QUALITY PROTEIN: SWI/SNF-related matrix-associated actin-dependent regulator of chromatin subfamily A-like protein 1 [Pollicipes pollicipes]
MPFQQDGIRMGVARGGRVLLADDMGLGKTIQAIGIMRYFHDWPLLVVCPSSMRYQWRQELHRFLPSQHPSTIVVMDTAKDFDADARILIVSYDLVTRCAGRLRDVGFLSVIMDESHCLKNHKAARTRAALPLMRAARRCLLLSGTPALSRPIELFTQICAVDRGFSPSFQDFGMRYCAGTRTAWGWDFSGASHMTELHALLERRVMIRRLKRDVIRQLPAKRRQMVLLDPSQVRARTAVMTQLEQRMGQRSLKSMERRGTLLQYFRETAGAKLPAVCSYLDDLLEAGNKFICFAHHQMVMDGVCELLTRRKHGFIRIDGATSAAQRKRECDRFQSGDGVLVAVLSITAANAGLTLTAANLVVFAELFWNPGVLTQAEDRAHRIGQQDCVQVRYLVARGTADDHIWPLVQSKLDVLNKAGLTKDDFTDASQGRQEQRGGQTAITDFFDEFEDLPPEALLEEPVEGTGDTNEPGEESAEGVTELNTGTEELAENVEWPESAEEWDGDWMESTSGADSDDDWVGPAKGRKNPTSSDGRGCPPPKRPRKGRV